MPLKRILKRVLLFIASGSMTIFLAACYGMPFGLIYPGFKCVVNMSGGKPVKGLSLKAVWSPASSLTDENGAAFLAYKSSSPFPVAGTLPITIEDIDGSANEGYFGTVAENLDVTKDVNLFTIDPK